MELDLRIKSTFKPELFDLLMTISNKKILDFNSVISSASELFPQNLDWWVERPASRNPLQSPLFYRFCCFYMINELIQSGTNIEKVTVDSPAMFNLVKKLKHKENYKFEIEGPDIELPNFQFFIRKSLKPILGAWKRARFQFRAAKKTKHFSSKPPRMNLILIDQFVFPGFISKERYYNGLWDALTIEQKEKTFFVPTLVMINQEDFEDVYRELRTSERNFLIKEDYLKIYDIIFSLFHLFRIWFIKPQPTEVLDIDFSSLIREELLLSPGFINAIDGILNYRFAKRLKGKSFDLSLVIDWWEGQPLDKGWNLGFNTFFPDTPRKGYLGYAPRSMELQLRPSETEIKCGVAPETISTIGEQFRNEMESSKPDFHVEIAPAFRFGHLWEDGSSSHRDLESFKILMALPIFMNESVNILEQVIDSGLVGEENEYEFMIKPHPAMKIEKLKMQLGERWSHAFKEVEGLTPDYIRICDLLITGTSSVGLEAVVLGVPVIVVETLIGLAYDPIPDSVPGELWRTCRSPNQISEEVRYFMNRNSEEVIKHQELSANIKKDYFEPVTKEGVRKFLMLD